MGLARRILQESSFTNPGATRLAAPGAANFVEPGLIIGQAQQTLPRQPITARRNNDCLTGILITNLRHRSLRILPAWKELRTTHSGSMGMVWIRPRMTG